MIFEEWLYTRPWVISGSFPHALRGGGLVPPSFAQHPPASGGERRERGEGGKGRGEGREGTPKGWLTSPHVMFQIWKIPWVTWHWWLLWWGQGERRHTDKEVFPSLVRHCETRWRCLFVTHLWQWRSSAHIWRLFGKTTQFELPQNLWNWTKPTETSRISVVRDVADWFWGWQQLTNYQDPEKKIGALGGDILKKQRFFENYAK